MTDAIRRFACREAADGESAHEHRPDGAGRVDSDAEYPAEHAEPQHLVHERAQTGGEEEDGEHREQPVPAQTTNAYQEAGIQPTRDCRRGSRGVK